MFDRITKYYDKDYNEIIFNTGSILDGKTITKDTLKECRIFIEDLERQRKLSKYKDKIYLTSQ